MTNDGGWLRAFFHEQVAEWLGWAISPRWQFQQMRRALAHDPTCSRLLSRVAYLEAQAGELASAQQRFAAACQGAPNDASLWFNRGFVLQKLGEHRGAIQALRHAAELDPKLDRAWFGLGLSLAQLGDDGSAADAFRRNTELQPLSPHGWYELALAQARLGLRQQAGDVAARLRGFEPKVARELEQGLRAGDFLSSGRT